MAILYLNRKDTTITREGAHLRIRQHTPEKEEKTDHVPLHTISGVVVVGEPSMTFPALSCFIGRQVPVTFLTSTGRWRGLLETCADNYAVRRKTQYHLSGNNAFFLPMAKSILSAKLYNARRAIQRLVANRPGWNWPETEDFHHEKQLKWLSQHLERAATLTALRGMEGLAAVHYFALLRHFFPAGIPFEKRRKHPAKDPANALLSWAYTLMLSEVTIALRLHGLDPAMGLLHAPSNRSPALALDLMEPFRPCMDLLVLNLFNHRILRADTHFQIMPSGAVHLNEAGRRRFFQSYEVALTRSFKPSKDATTTTLRGLIDQQVSLFLHQLEAFPVLSPSSKAFFHLP